jgi:hypothetical protein
MRVIPAHDLYDWCAKWKAAAAKHKNSRAAKAIIDTCDEMIAHFGLTSGANLTIIRDERDHPV